MPARWSMGYPRTTVRRTARHLLVALFATCLWQACAHAGTTVQDIQKRGTLRCGVSDAVPGLAARDAAGRWQGLETDFCRAVAAATLGDAERVEFVALRASQRFPALLTNRVDLLLGNTTCDASRFRAATPDRRVGHRGRGCLLCRALRSAHGGRLATGSTEAARGEVGRRLSHPAARDFP